MKICGFRSTTFGIYEPGTFGISLHNMRSMVEAARKDEDRLQRWLMDIENAHRPPAFRYESSEKFVEDVNKGRTTLHLSEVEFANWEKMKLKHQEDFDFYYRVRVHEKNHWYTHISSAVPIARFFAGQDACHFLWDALRQVTSRRICVPLADWARDSTCPETLRAPLRIYQVRQLIDAAIDGDLPPWGDSHLLASCFPDLDPRSLFWETSVYQIGYRALVEGAGKAAEWLYDLKRGKPVETKAWEDINAAPPIYSVALKELVAVLPGKSLLEYLQVLSVLVEFAINPFIEAEAWPYLHGKAPAKDMLPGFRYQRLLQLLKGGPAFDAKSKESIAAFFTKATQRNYGWTSPQESAKQLLKLLTKARTIGLEEHGDKLWNPLETMLRALAIKAQMDPLAYVAPINAPIINASETYPQVMITEPGLTAGSKAATLTYARMWHGQALLETLVHSNCSNCPCTSNEWFGYLISMIGRSDEAGNQPQIVPRHVRDCAFCGPHLRADYGDLVDRMESLK